MLQQTRVETVIPYYERWLRTFPTVEALARAPLGRVLKLWEGLGYYSRARNLHRAARQVAGKSFAQEFRNLPGIGRYTAGAIASIAFDERAALVDGNVARVFARVFNIRANVKLPATLEKMWSLAEELLPVRRCSDFNQALMELGALVCLPASPQCEACPLMGVCEAPGDALPNRGPKQKMRTETHNVVWMVRDGKIRMRQRPTTGLLAGMWELPECEGDSGRLLLTVRHTITNRRITLRVFDGETHEGRWVSRRESERLAMPAAHRRVVSRLLASAK